MTTRSTSNSTAGDSARMQCIRAAWLYYIEGMTQNEMASALGIIRIHSDLAELMEMQRGLEQRYGLERAILAPFSDPTGDATRVIAATLGAHISDLMVNHMTIGVGWGKTLHTALRYIEGRALEGVRVISLLGGIAEARRFNSAEFAWQFAELFDAEGYLVPAPALIDRSETRESLMEQCGLDRIFQLHEHSDAAVFSCGGIESLTTSYRLGHISEADRQSLIAAGAVGDVLYNFIDATGAPVDHPVNARTLSISLERLARIPKKILVSGGANKLAVLQATLTTLRPTTFITCEPTARALLAEILCPW